MLFPLSLGSRNSQIFEAAPIQKTDLAAPTLRDTATSAMRYLAVAVIVATVAGCLFMVCPPACFALLGLSGWLAWSATIIILNHAARDTCIAKPIHCLHTLTTEVNSIFFTIPLFPLTFFKCYHQPKENTGEGIPILMINGYLSFGSTWDFQARGLNGAKLGPVHTMNIGSGKSIRTYADEVAEKVDRICKEHGTDKIILVGHSKGGLVISHYTTALAQKRNVNVTAVITIGSPLQGTPVAHVGIGHDAGQMKPDSHFIQELTGLRTNYNGNTRFYHIASRTDEIVPFHSALPENADEKRQLVLNDAGHLGLVFDSRVRRQLCRWVRLENQLVLAEG